jgi:hypothetical protein
MPNASNSFPTTLFALAPMEVMAMTELIPMMIPAWSGKNAFYCPDRSQGQFNIFQN